MPRTKKTRKPGQIGTPKAEKKQVSGQKSPSNPPRKKNSHKGQASGSRNSLVERTGEPNLAKSTKQDKRLGSKKKIALLAEKREKETKKQLVPKFKSPVDEVDYIENDKKLQGLLDKLDQQISVSPEEQVYVDTLINRHKLLCELLGMRPDEEVVDVEAAAEPEDLLDKLERDFKF